MFRQYLGVEDGVFDNVINDYNGLVLKAKLAQTERPKVLVETERTMVCRRLIFLFGGNILVRVPAVPRGGRWLHNQPKPVRDGTLCR